MKIMEYARVSSEGQDKEDKVSIDQQLADMQALVERNGWEVVGVFIDRENYKATQNPKRGKIVNPSGERADRPAFLEVLEAIRTGDIDAILCWRDDRLVRHPRVNVALEDAMDEGDKERKGKPKIDIYDATGAKLDRFTMSIKAAVWKEENKRRAERIRMGKVATLQQGRWPSRYPRLGYTTRKEPGKRGRIIELVESEAETVKQIFDLCDAGRMLREISQILATRGVEQKGNSTRRHEWNPAIISEILRCEDYTGKATWQFGDGTKYTIEIPQIIPLHQWKKVQKRLAQNRKLSTRRANGIYLLQGLTQCGDCGAAVCAEAVRYFYYKRPDGTRERREHKRPTHRYRCGLAAKYPNETHPRPSYWWGRTLDWAVWRRVVDEGIKQPEKIREQVLARQAKLREEDDNIHGEITNAKSKLTEVDQQRAFYQRQASRGKMTESEFDDRMDETQETRKYWEDELARLRELRDDQAKVQNGLEYAFELMTRINGRLDEIDLPPEEFRALSEDRQRKVLKARREIIRALCDKVKVYTSGRVVVEGVLDGSEAAQFELESLNRRCFPEK